MSVVERLERCLTAVSHCLAAIRLKLKWTPRIRLYGTALGRLEIFRSCVRQQRPVS